MITTQQVRRPLVGMALSLIAGLQAQHLLEGPPLLFLGLSAIVLSIACWIFHRRRAGGALFLGLAMLAATYVALEKTAWAHHEVLSVAEVQLKEQEMVGRIDEPPSALDTGDISSFRFRTAAVRLGTNWIRTDSVLRVYLDSSEAPPEFGETWRFRGRYQSYETSRSGAVGSFRAREAVRLKGSGPSVRRVCDNARQRAAAVLRAGMDSFPEQTRLLSALLLGYRRALSSELYQLFADTGTLHIFAISGLHVGVLAAILIAVLKTAGISKLRWGVLLIPALLFYVVSTGMKPSAVRAFTMAAVYFAAPLFGRRPDVASSIALAAMILLAFDPLQIWNPGFLLSFTVVSGIVMVHGAVHRQFSGLSRPGWAVPLAQISGARPWRALVRMTGMLALTSAAAWFFSAPLTVRFFNTLSPVALLGNLVIIPLTFLIVLTGCLTLATATVSLPAAVVLNHSNRVWIDLLIGSIRWMRSLPGSCLYLRSPAGSVLVFWYAGLVLFCTGTARLRRLGAVFVAGSVLLWAGSLYQPFSGIEVYPQGSTSTVVRISPAKWVLFSDGAPYSTRQTVRQLQRSGINRLHALVVSDPRADAEAIDKLARIFSPEQVWMGPALKDGPVAERLKNYSDAVRFSDRARWPVGFGHLSTFLGE